MTRRTRSFLIDNTLGKVFTGVTGTADSTPDKLIAGTKLLVKSLATNKSVQVVPIRNLGVGTPGMYLSASNSLVTRIDLSVSQTATGNSIIIRVRKGTSYDTSEIISDYELPALAGTVGFNTAINVASTETLYFDIAQSGSTRRGAGLSIRVSYYTG